MFITTVILRQRPVISHPRSRGLAARTCRTATAYLRRMSLMTVIDCVRCTRSMSFLTTQSSVCGAGPRNRFRIPSSDMANGLPHDNGWSNTLCISGLHVCGPGVLDADFRVDLGAASAFVMYYETDACLVNSQMLRYLHPNNASMNEHYHRA